MTRHNSVFDVPALPCVPSGLRVAAKQEGGARRGLSLIELLIVIAIMAAAAGMVVSMTDRMDTSNRYQETAKRLGEIRSAILGPDAITPSGDLMSGGYLQDVGSLPASGSDLLSKPANVTTLAYSAKWRTWAGWRGPYVTAPPRRKGDAAAALYDDYGNDFLWARGGGTNDYLAVRSLGSDGKAGGSGTYEADYPAADQPLVPQSDWVTNLSQLRIEVSNWSPASPTVHVRIIVPRWDQADPLGYTAAGGDDFVGDEERSLAPATGGSDADHPLVAGVTTIRYRSGAGTARIPNGRRMLFLVDQNNRPINASTGAFIADGDESARPVCAELAVSRRVSPPSVVRLTIRP